MPNGRYRYYDLQLGVEGEQGGERGLQSCACLARTYDPPGKERVRQLVAVGHNLARLLEDERPGRAEGHEEEAGGEEEFPRALELAVHHPQRIFRSSRGELCVVLKAEPPPLITNNVLLVKRPILSESLKLPGQGQRVVSRSKGVDTDFELRLLEPLAHVLCRDQSEGKSLLGCLHRRNRTP
eukprot:765550-Hanusia_phi.AAC.2